METVQERRRAKRVKRRLGVRFGETELNRAGFTYDISKVGLFVVSDGAPPANGRIHVQLFLDNEHFVLLEGVVVRRKEVPAELRGSAQGGFGVRLLGLNELLLGVVPEDTPPIQNHFAVEYASAVDLRRAISGELNMGGVFLPTTKTLPAGTDALIEMRLPFARMTLQFPARVLQSTDPSLGGTQGIAFVFVDRERVVAALSPVLGDPDQRR